VCVSVSVRVCVQGKPGTLVGCNGVPDSCGVLPKCRVISSRKATCHVGMLQGRANLCDVDAEQMKLLGECKIATCTIGLVRLQYLVWLPSMVLPQVVVASCGVERQGDKRLKITTLDFYTDVISSPWLGHSLC
jgi:hypothetical protein